MYYENLDMLLFRGNTNEKMHKYIKSQLKQEREYDHWELVTVGTEWYVINIKKYNDFYGGVWMPAAQIQEQLSVEEEALMGIMYMMDWRNENTAPTTLVHERLKTVGYQNIVNGKTTIQLEDTVYYNNIIKTEEGEIYFGILIPKNFFYFRIPTAVKGIVVLLIISIQLFYIRINIFVCS